MPFPAQSGPCPSPPPFRPPPNPSLRPWPPLRKPPSCTPPYSSAFPSAANASPSPARRTAGCPRAVSTWRARTRCPGPPQAHPTQWLQAHKQRHEQEQEEEQRGERRRAAPESGNRTERRGLWRPTSCAHAAVGTAGQAVATGCHRLILTRTFRHVVGSGRALGASLTVLVLGHGVVVGVRLLHRLEVPAVRRG